jgi:hypothetical protein
VEFRHSELCAQQYRHGRLGLGSETCCLRWNLSRSTSVPPGKCLYIYIKSDSFDIDAFFGLKAPSNSFGSA